MRQFLILLFALLLCLPAMAQEEIHNTQPYNEWLEELKREAREQGISQRILDEAFTETEPIERIVELDRTQPESTVTLQQYLKRVVTDKRIEDGRTFKAEHRELLDKIGKQYGVQPRFIVALWGIETNYGSNTGSFSTIDALATLAYDGRRSEFFRDELLKALSILEQGHIEPADMQGSWAGAMGQCQFMPSSFIQFAIDHDQDGKRDIWNNQADVFASIANYLKSSGWDDNLGWGRRVKLPPGFDHSLLDIKQTKPLKEWSRLGVKTSGGKSLPDRDLNASLIWVGEEKDAVPYIVYNNYKVLLKWNRSRYFATAVGTLADKLGK